MGKANFSFALARSICSNIKPMGRRSGFIEISAETLEALRSENIRTGLSPLAIYRLIVDAGKAPERVRFTPNIISSWLHGVTKSADKDALSLVLKEYGKQPDVDKSIAVGRLKNLMSYTNILAGVEFMSSLRNRLSQTKYARRSLLLHHSCPKDFDAGKLSCLLVGKTKIITREQYEFLSSYIGFSSQECSKN